MFTTITKGDGEPGEGRVKVLIIVVDLEDYWFTFINFQIGAIELKVIYNNNQPIGYQILLSPPQDVLGNQIATLENESCWPIVVYTLNLILPICIKVNMPSVDTSKPTSIYVVVEFDQKFYDPS